MTPALQRIILRSNPWLRGEDVQGWLDSRIPARYVERRATLRLDAGACLVVGPRQAGKSTLAWRALQERAEPVLFLNAEEPSIREWLGSATLFVDEASDLCGRLPALFFDEIQHHPEAGLFLKGLVDQRLDVPIVATGSSSFDLRSRTRESLAGRAQRTLLLPFSLDELEPAGNRAPIAVEHARRERRGQLLLYGGYPTVVLGERPVDTLAHLVESLVLRDASDRFRIQHLAAFRKVIELAARQIGNLCVVAEWASIAGVSSGTVNDYLEILEETHVLRLLRPFLGGKRAEVTAARKAYFLDNGLRNVLFGGFTPIEDRADAGALYENFAFSEIWKSVNPLLDTVRYWRSKSGAEVDFVVEHRGRRMAVEVKAGDPHARVTRSSRSFVEAYHPELLVVVGAEPHPDDGLGPTRVRFVRPEEVAAIVRDFVAE